MQAGAVSDPELDERKVARLLLMQSTLEMAHGREIAQAFKENICPISLGNRKDFFRAQSFGLTVQEYAPESIATKEIKNLYNYINSKLYDI